MRGTGALAKQEKIEEIGPSLKLVAVNKKRCESDNLLRDRYTRYAGQLAETTVAVLMEVSVDDIRAATRSRADIAFARQVAMYIAHVSFGLSFSETGQYFRRDRTTVSHACQLVEDERDDPRIEALLHRIEEIINAAQEAFFSGNTDISA